MFKGPGEVAKNEFSEETINDVISQGNLYVVEAPNYPRTEQEKEEAHNRF